MFKNNDEIGIIIASISAVFLLGVSIEPLLTLIEGKAALIIFTLGILAAETHHTFPTY